ncbi:MULTISPECIES: peptidogalycan biosysnthesis protein [Comamonas]|uniref:ATP synthase subunit alpha n=1 Tax=Comamonas thiooxydans TaxID=363952 RepID=A0A096DW24_9BURK|nr:MULTISPECIES: peptidogalycan biosysnthesis protein [Comamonas]KGG84601.1 ATP synthase subunit alpha [Comamonas thiooxydans]KGG95966.1 ATP synthase subunit alpha [Comamonas thiooxydans]KGH02350.1 ATP synthase subunit alpha [Comamonas thiooxydans]KGH09619.1 ATP synthase subunit alpha [Comamonas thiooxydans]KGH16070.1 ATP synthase subunit alpha [Comamonas thiooxydans]
MATENFRNQLEPSGLLQQFTNHPPEGFALLKEWPAPAFTAPFDLLTTADDALKARLLSLPGGRFLSSRLRLKTDFIGSTVSEYAPLPQGVDAATLARQLRAVAGRTMLTIVKDLPQASPLLSASDNDFAKALSQALAEQGFVTLEGQALAYVPLGFASTDEYLAGLSKNRRSSLRRKLKSRAELDIRRLPTGAAFADENRIDAYYALFEAVYAQSEIHFDKLSRAFLAGLLRDEDNGGIVFEYRDRQSDALLGWNLCFEHDGRLIDKYIGLSYPAAREANLYFVSWMVNLEYALERGLSHYVAGWTDPEVKAQLGASFTMTQHLVFIRNPLLRALGRRFSGLFESDRQWSDKA